MSSIPGTGVRFKMRGYVMREASVNKLMNYSEGFENTVLFYGHPVKFFTHWGNMKYTLRTRRVSNNARVFLDTLKFM